MMLTEASQLHFVNAQLRIVIVSMQCVPYIFSTLSGKVPLLGSIVYSYNVLQCSAVQYTFWSMYCSTFWGECSSSSVHRCPTFGSLPLITHCTARPGLVLLTHLRLSHRHRHRYFRGLPHHDNHQCLSYLHQPLHTFHCNQKIACWWFGKGEMLIKLAILQILPPQLIFLAEFESLVKGQLSSQSYILKIQDKIRWDKI